jgi:glycosyltransferase involved in cell wall biosynthesis
MLGWKGTPTGIPRTVYCLAEAIRALSQEDIQLLAFDDKNRRFGLLDKDGDKFLTSARVNFREEDIFLSVGANWAFEYYNNEIERLCKNGVRFFQMFYDLIPALFPYMYEQGNGFGNYYGNWAKNTVGLVEGGFTISQCSKQDLLNWCGKDSITARKIKVVRLGEDFLHDANGKTLAHDSPLRNLGPFILCVGTLELRKNQVVLLQAYRELVKTDREFLPKLVFVGRQGWLDGNIPFQVKNDRDLIDRVIVLSDVTDNELDYLYEHCLFTVFPAFYEGWGLPVAESLCHGKPCITSNTSSMIEIAPEYTWFASPYRPDEWASWIRRLARNTDLISRHAIKIKNEYRPTPWTQTAREILDFL